MAQRYHTLDPAHADGHPRRSAPTNATTYYSFIDAEGDKHIVDSLGLVPPGATHVQRITLHNEASPAPEDTKSQSLGDRALQMLNVPHLDEAPGLGEQSAPPSAAAVGVPPPEQLLRNVPHIPTSNAAIGAAVAFCAGMAVRQLRLQVMRAGMAIVGLTFAGSVYLRWMDQRMTALGMRGGPAHIMENVKAAAGAAQQRMVEDADAASNAASP